MVIAVQLNEIARVEDGEKKQGIKKVEEKNGGRKKGQRRFSPLWNETIDKLDFVEREIYSFLEFSFNCTECLSP
jgi:hypothetical protein